MAESSVHPTASDPPPPLIPDHELVRRIGRGAFGEVWLARNVLGAYRAAKVIHRADFPNDRAYEREYQGIQHYEPVSRTHDGLVDILQVGRNEAGGFYYHVMELADHAAGEEWTAATYQPHTLAHELDVHERLPTPACIELGLSLTAALGHLHANGLVHRDIKPANIIFVAGRPRLADIGLVAARSEAESFVGTLGYVPPEGPGSAQADLYALGKVLYEISTGRDRQEFPSLPTELGERRGDTALVELNEVLLKACAADPARRYRSAEEMQADLLLLKTGRSVRHTRRLERRVRLFKRAAAVTAGLIALASVSLFVWETQRQQTLERERHLRQLAETERQRAEDARDREERQTYWTTIQLVNSRISNGDFDGVRRMLLETKPALRGWEWGYLMAKVPQPEWELAAHRGALTALALFPDETRLVTVGADGVIACWELPERQLRWSHQSGGPCHSVDVDPTGRLVAVAEEARLLILKAGDGELLHASAPIQPTAVRFGAGGKTLAVVTRTGQLLGCASDDWKFQTVLAVEKTPGLRLFTDPGRSRFAVSVIHAATLRLFDSDTFQPDGTRELPSTPHGIGPVLLDPERNRLVYGDWRQAHLTELRGDSARRQMLCDFPRVVTAIAGPPGMTRYAVGTAGGVVRWLDSTASQFQEFHHDRPVTAVAVLRTGRILSAGDDGTVKCWNPPQAVPPPNDHFVDVREYQTGDRIALRDDDKLAAVIGYRTSNARLIDLATRQPRPVELPGPAYRFFAFRPGTAELAVSLTNAIQFYDTAGGGWRLVRQIETPRPAASGAFDRKGRWMVVSYAERGSEWFDLQPSPAARRPLSVTGRCKVAISPDGRVLATADYARGIVSLLNAATGRLLWSAECSGTTTDHFPLAFDPDGRLIAAGTPAFEVRVWEVASGRLVAKLLDHSDEIGALQFSPDGRRVMSGSLDFTVKIWDRQIERPLLTLTNRFYSCITARFTPDGLTLVSGDANPDVRIRRAVPWHQPATEPPGYPTAPTLDFSRAIAATNLRLPPRHTDAPPHTMDLSRFYNAPLDQPWLDADPGNGLASLPPGVHRFAGVEFDVRGIIQTACTRLTERGFNYPEAVRGIQINQKARRLQFLHAGAYLDPPSGQLIGRYVLHYADGTEAELRLLSSQNIRSWSGVADRPAYQLPTEGPTVVAWHGTNATAKLAGRANWLFKTAWENPRPDVEIQSLDVVSHNTRIAFFLLAVTADDRERDPLAAPGRDFAKVREQIPVRDPAATPNLIDLSRHYNASLKETWHGPAPLNSLHSLPTGLQTFGTVPFDVRGIVQVSSTNLAPRNPEYPPAVTGIPVNQQFRKLHALHAAIWGQFVADGTEIGAYVLHYADGQSRRLPIIRGEHVQNWWHTREGESANAPLAPAWTGTNEASGARGLTIRLFQTTWANPRPAFPVRSIDFISTMTAAAPFLIALTVENDPADWPAGNRTPTAPVPARDPAAPPNLIDLSAHYNAVLAESWSNPGKGNDLASLPSGLQRFAGVQFDVRGVIQLGGPALEERGLNYPERVDGIHLGLKARRVHFLHATGWGELAEDGTHIATYRMHYVDGRQTDFKIIKGRHVRGWWFPSYHDPDKGDLTPVWTGSNQASRGAGKNIRLYQTTWENPAPGIVIRAIDYVTAGTVAAPFLVAITAE